MKLYNLKWKGNANNCAQDNNKINTEIQYEKHETRQRLCRIIPNKNSASSKSKQEQQKIQSPLDICISQLAKVDITILDREFQRVFRCAASTVQASGAVDYLCSWPLAEQWSERRSAVEHGTDRLAAGAAVSRCYTTSLHENEDAPLHPMTKIH